MYQFMCVVFAFWAASFVSPAIAEEEHPCQWGLEKVQPSEVLIHSSCTNGNFDELRMALVDEFNNGEDEFCGQLISIMPDEEMRILLNCSL